jgi:hypothetical protein
LVSLFGHHHFHILPHDMMTTNLHPFISLKNGYLSNRTR